MMRSTFIWALLTTMVLSVTARAQVQNPLKDQEPNSWVKRSPLPDAPLSPMLGYEGSFGYDPNAKVVIRWAGHNQGGGGEQNAETWTFDPVTAKWTLKEPNTSPPGACCNAQNVFDPAGGRFVRFPAFSGSHGWHWFRENYLNNSSVWTYDLAKNTWRDMRPAPTPRPAPLRGASWDSDHGVIVVFGGEGGNDGTIVYDPYTNEWTRMNPKKEPAGRSAGTMAYHKALKKHILFGSQFTDDPHTWAYDLVKNEWTDLMPKVMPPTKENDAVLTYDEINNVIVASVRVLGKNNSEDGWHYETWVYDGGANTWKAVNPKAEPPGGGQRRRIMVAVPDQNVILMENYVNPPQKVPGTDREQQIWTYRYDRPAKEGMVTPLDARILTWTRDASLFWDGPPCSQWLVRRTQGAKPWTAKELEDVALRGDRKGTLDDTQEPGQTRYYSVTAVDAQNRRSLPTVLLRTQPHLVEDVIASVHSTTKITLDWPASKDVIAGYHIERAPVEVFSEDQIVRLRTDTPPLKQPSVGAIKSIGKFKRLTKQPIQDTTFTDIGVDLAQRVDVKDEIYRHRFGAKQLNEDGRPYRFAVYAYRVRAVNKLGIESGPGPYALTIPSAPQWVFSKEEGKTCHLKWQPNSKKGVKGYRIYRMESPRINGPGQPVTRLTKEPIADTGYADENADKQTRRYWIVAVDALGQEGYPSAPVWFERQFKKHYVPFTGEWHQ